MNALVPLAAFAVGFPLLWVAICAFASACGWGVLGRRFPRRHEVPVAEYGWQSVVVIAGWMPSSYSNCTTLGANADGLFLRVALPFRPFHPPLFIPWAAVETTARKHWFGSSVELTFPDEPGVTVRPTKRTVERLAEAIGRWPEQGAAGCG